MQSSGIHVLTQLLKSREQNWLDYEQTVLASSDAGPDAMISIGATFETMTLDDFSFVCSHQ